MTQFQTWFYRMKEKQYKKQWEQKLRCKQLLKGVEKRISLTELESQLDCSCRKLIEWIEQLDQEGYDLTGKRSS